MLQDSLYFHFTLSTEVGKMTSKLVLIAAICIAQGFAFKVVPRAPGKGPCKNPVSESAEEIAHDFEETMHEMEEMEETASMTAMDAYYKGTDPDVIIACYRQQKGSYSKLGGQISRMIRNASVEMRKELGDQYEKYYKMAEVPLRTIGITMKTLPGKMWLHIKEKEFSQAFEVMKESRKIVQENSKIISGILNEMAEEVPEAADKAREMAREIRATARNGCRAIADAFRKCVEEGGPKKPVEEAEIEADVEETAEQ